MAIQNINTLKNWYRTGLKPAQQHFWDWLDSFRHKNDKVPVADVEGIDELLLTKASQEVLENHFTSETSHEFLFLYKEDKINKGSANGYVPLNEVVKISYQYLNIVDDLVSGGSTDLLSAQQGLILQTQIDAINVLLNSDDINMDTLQEIVDAIKEVDTYLSTILVNDLTSGGATKALTAEMGKTLKILLDNFITATNLKFDKVIGYVTPEQFGAIGNGVADDTAAFVSALAVSNYVYTLSGHTYLIGDVDVVGKKVYGNGTIRKKATSECAFHIKGENSMISTLKFDAEPVISQPSGDIKLGDAAKNIVIANCTFLSKTYSAIIGSVDTTTGGTIYTNKVDGVLIIGNIFAKKESESLGYDRPIYLHSVSNITIQGNVIRDTDRDAIRLRENDGNCIITGNTFINIGNSLWPDIQTRDAVDVYWSGNTLTISNNIITKTAHTGFDIKGTNSTGTNKTSRVIVTGNQISHTRFHGIFIQGNVVNPNFYYTESIIVANNIISNCNDDGGTSGYGIFCDGLVRYVNIHDNVVTETKGKGIVFTNAYPLTSLGTKNIKITGNQCFNNGRNGVTAVSEAGISINSIDGVILKDNICDNDTGLPNPYQASGIYINSTSTGFPTSKSMIVDKNICRNNLTGQIYIDANNQRADNIASFEGNIQIGPGAVNRAAWQDQRSTFWGNGIPSTGDGIFTKGDIINNISPTVVGTAGNKYIVSGWKRISVTGNTHVLDVDWVEMRTLTDILTSSGTYIPTLTNVTNVSASSLVSATYTRVGNIVTVRISFGATHTAPGVDSQIKFTLPINRTLSDNKAIGSGTTSWGSIYNSILVMTELNNSQATAYMLGITGTSNVAGSIEFQYSVLE